MNAPQAQAQRPSAESETPARRVTLLQLMILVVLGGLAIWFVYWLFFTSPKKPYLPRFYYEDYRSVITTPVSVNVVKDYSGSLLKPEYGHQHAIFRFDAPEGTQSGALVADVLALKLRKSKISILERDNIDRILNEQKLASRSPRLADQQRIGQLLSVQYMAVGAVTFYDASPHAVVLPLKLVEEDRKEYRKQYDVYRKWYLDTWWPFAAPEEERIQRLRTDVKVLSLEELEEEYKKFNRSEFRVVATVGVSMKIIRVRDARIVWAGQGETNDVSLVNGVTRIVDEFIKSM